MAVASLVVVTATLVATLSTVRNDLNRGLIAAAELPLLEENYRRTLDQIETVVSPGAVLLGDKQLAYYAWRLGKIDEAEAAVERERAQHPELDTLLDRAARHIRTLPAIERAPPESAAEPPAS